MERSNRKQEPFVFTFIDYSKAFDSLNWDNLWRTLSFAGCPNKLIAVIRAFYKQSSISIRITKDGELAPEFLQKRGIRQGLSLSPCLFVVAMDFCLRVFEATCDELGLPSHEHTWTAYADDIADKSVTESEASEALQQLEAASAFVGLRLNVDKTEAMAKTQVDTKHNQEPWKQRVSVTFDDGKFQDGGRKTDLHISWIRSSNRRRKQQESVQFALMMEI